MNYNNEDLLHILEKLNENLRVIGILLWFVLLFLAILINIGLAITLIMMTVLILVFRKAEVEENTRLGEQSKYT